MEYFDLKKNWAKVKPHISNEKVQRVLVRDMNVLFKSRWKKEFEKGKVPRDYECCDWEHNLNHKGRTPEYWKYVKFGACHWLVNFNLELAKLVLPDESWVIVSSERHSTVWNGKDLIFEFNFQAFGISADDCFSIAKTNGRILKIGRHKKCKELEFWLEEIAREKAECELNGTVFTPHG